MSVIVIDGEEFDAVCSRCHHEVTIDADNVIVHTEAAQAAACALFYGPGPGRLTPGREKDDLGE